MTQADPRNLYREGKAVADRLPAGRARRRMARWDAKSKKALAKQDKVLDQLEHKRKRADTMRRAGMSDKSLLGRWINLRQKRLENKAGRLGAKAGRLAGTNTSGIRGKLMQLRRTKATVTNTVFGWRGVAAAGAAVGGTAVICLKSGCRCSARSSAAPPHLLPAAAPRATWPRRSDTSTTTPSGTRSPRVATTPTWTACRSSTTASSIRATARPSSWVRTRSPPPPWRNLCSRRASRRSSGTGRWTPCNAATSSSTPSSTRRSMPATARTTARTKTSTAPTATRRRRGIAGVLLERRLGHGPASHRRGGRHHSRAVRQRRVLRHLLHPARLLRQRP